jgi:hypothetical protein
MSTTTATEQGLPALDSPTVAAAAVTLAFAVGCAAALGSMPQDGMLGGALDAIKNIVYVLTVPLFDIARRLFARSARKSPAPSSGTTGVDSNIFGLAFVTALLLFMLVEIISWLTGFSMGGACMLLSQAGKVTDFGECVAIGVPVFIFALIAPITLALGATAGWMWKGMLRSGLLLALLIFIGVIGVLFALDYSFFLRQPAANAQALQDQFIAFGPVRQIGVAVALTTFGLLLGYGMRSLWHRVARVFG